MSKAFMRMCVMLGTLILVSCSATSGDIAGTDWSRSVADQPGVTADGTTSVAGYIQTSGELEYDEDIIEVWYSADFAMPEGLAGYTLTGPDSAAAQPNSILRQNSEYEDLTDALAARYGLAVRRQLYWGQVNFATFDLPAGTDGDALLTELSNAWPGVVDYVSFAGLAKPAWIPTDPDYSDNNSYGGVLWGLKNVNVAPAWDYTRGSRSVRVAVVDSGVRLTHEELDGQVLTPEELASEIPDGWSLDIANGDNTVEDLSGHGTMCAGAIGAAANGNTIIGVAPNVTMLPVKINNTGSFPWTDGYAGITLAHLLGADVISCSWGHAGGFNPQEKTIIQQVTDGGSLVVAAAGNEDTTAAHYPSDFEDVVCVGANDPDDVRCDFSNYGSAVDIAAPGQWMKRALHTGDSDYDDVGGGTSYACPMVAGAVALLASADPSLSFDEIRNILETTGDPVSGFQDGVLRMNIGNAMAETTAVQLSLPRPDQLVHHGTITITPEVAGDVERVECYFNGVIATTLYEEPWDFEIDTTGVNFGLTTVEFRAAQGSETASESLQIMVDNSNGVYPLTEGFENATRDFIPVDYSEYSVGLLDEIRTYGELGSYWTADDLRGAGSGAWADTLADVYEGVVCQQFGNVTNGYDSWEADVLVSRLVDLTEADDPTMVYHQHYNIQRGAAIYDRAWVLVSQDYGLTFSPAKLESGDEALFSGFVEDWETVNIDLSEYAGSKVHIAFAFESGRQNSGADSGFTPGWWVDDISIALGYQEHLPTIGGLNLTPYSTFGSIVQADQIDVEIAESNNVVRVEFILEYLPTGAAEPQQLKIDAASQPFGAVLDVPLDAPNQIAYLEVYYYNDGDAPGPVKNIPVYLFNQLGDTNADGTVGQADVDGYAGMIGLVREDAGYIPFYDSDLDGIITETDAAAVGYNWTE